MFWLFHKVNPHTNLIHPIIENSCEQTGVNLSVMFSLGEFSGGLDYFYIKS